MKIFGSIGRIGSGKDEVIKYFGRQCGLPVISVGDMVRQMASDQGLPLTRENLHEVSSKIFRDKGKDYFMSLALDKMKENGWEEAGITGIRTPEDVRFLKDKLDRDFVLFHVYVGDPRTRYRRLRGRRSERDPHDYDAFEAQDADEEAMFHVEDASAMADYSLDNHRTREDLHRQIDKIVQEECLGLDLVRNKEADHA
jgi:dephospho-CoA kinase